MATHRTAANALRSLESSRHEAQMPRLLLAVVSSNSAAFDAAGAGFPWSHLQDGAPPRDLVRIAPELRYKAAPPGTAVMGKVVATQPFGFVADRLSAVGKPGLRRPLSIGLLSKQVRTHIGLAGSSPAALQVEGSASRIDNASHPILRGFIVIPYGTVHRCRPPDLSRPPPNWSPTTPAVSHRPRLAVFIGCLSSPTPWRQQGRGSLWQARSVLASPSWHRLLKTRGLSGRKELVKVDTAVVHVTKGPSTESCRF